MAGGGGFKALYVSVFTGTPSTQLYGESWKLQYVRESLVFKSQHRSSWRQHVLGNPRHTKKLLQRPI